MENNHLCKYKHIRGSNPSNPKDAGRDTFTRRTEGNTHLPDEIS